MSAQKKFTIPTDVEFLRILWCDNANIIRAKSVYINSLKEFNPFVGISESYQGITSMADAVDGVLEDSGLTHTGEIKLKADFSSYTDIPYSPGHGRVMGDMIKNGKPWDYDPRGFLKKIINIASKSGFSVKGAFENEFYLLIKDKKGIHPSDNTPFASTHSIDINQDVMTDIIENLILQGLEVQQYFPESGWGQQEITIKYTDALKACDNQIILRETVRAIARKHDLIGSFLPMIFANKSGNRCNLHLSLWKDDKNILPDSENEHGISEEGSQFIAGILHHLPGLMAITSPIPNSYRRIAAHSNYGEFQCWGINNKQASIRVIRNQNGTIENFEIKTADSSSNPYLAMGSIIAAGINGIKREMKLEEPCQNDPVNILDINGNFKIKKLPSDLNQAVSELKNDRVILSALGKNLSKAYIAIKETEERLLRTTNLKSEVELLLEIY